MKRTKVLSILLALILVAVFSITGCSQGAKKDDPASGAEPEKIILKVGHIGTEQSHHHATLTALGDLIKQKTNGRVEVEIYTNSALGAERELVESLQTGSVDIACAATAVIANFIPEFTVLDMPYIFEDLNQAKDLLNSGELGKDFDEKLESQNLISLGYWDVGYRNLQTTSPVRTFSDVAGKKFRVMESPIYMTLFDSFGAIPSPMAFSEVFTALQQGTIDGVDLPTMMFYTSGVYQAANYCINTKHCVSLMVTAMSKKTFDKLPEDIQKQILEAAKEAIPIAYTERDRITKESEEQLKANNVEIIDIDIAPFKAAAEKVYDNLVGSKISQELVDKIRNAK